MSLTLTEGNKYSTTELQRVIIDLLVQDSRILELLPFEEIIGNSLTYDVITTDSTANFYSVGDTWTESTPSMTQYTVTLKQLGKDADIDKFLLKTRSNKTDLRGTIVNNSTKAVQYKYLDTFFYGDTATNTKSFAGLHVLLANTAYNTVHAGTADSAGTALSTAKLRQAIDLITGYKPTHIILSKAARRNISTYLDSIGSAFPRGADEFGRPVEKFDNLELVVDDHIGNVETATSSAYLASTGGALTSLFVATFGPLACCGVHDGDRVQVEDLGTLETKDATRIRIKWYCGLMLQAIRSCAKVDGITNATATA